MLPQYNINTTTAKALTSVVAAHLPNEMIKNPVFILDLYKEAAEELVILNKEDVGFGDVKNDHLLRMVSNSEIFFLDVGQEINLKNGGLLFYGKINKKKAIKYFRPVNETARVNESSIFMNFPDLLGQSLSATEIIREAFLNYYIKSLKTSKTLKIETGLKVKEAYRHSANLSLLPA